MLCAISSVSSNLIVEAVVITSRIPRKGSIEFTDTDTSAICYKSRIKANPRLCVPNSRTHL